jgi:hypothetical protein
LSSVEALTTRWRGTATTPLDPDTAFNGFICAQVLFALERLGVFRALNDQDVLDVPALCAQDGLDTDVVGALLGFAESYGYLAVEDDKVRMTRTGEEGRRMLGFFTWGVGGYHDIFANAAAVARGERTFRVDLQRDEAMVALGSAQADTALMRHILDAEIAQIDYHTLVDLGAGTSERVSRLVRDRPGGRGIGVDISQPATDLAVGTIARYGLTGSVVPVCADVLDILFNGRRVDGADSADVVMSFMFLHDLLVDPSRRGQVIPRLRESFPNAHTFLLADTTIRPRDPDGDATLPIFSSGFELAHALMGVPIYTRTAYEDLFESGGLRIRRTVPFGAPHTYLFVLEAA